MPKKRPTPSLGQVSDAELRLLRVFKAVVEHGGFATAASALGVTPATVSIHMATLETRLRLRLCQRGRSGFTLTAEGRKVYEASQRLLAAADNFRTEVGGLYDTLRGEFNIAISDNLVTLPRMRVSEALVALKAQGPEIHINIHMGPPDEVERGVVDGRFHVGVAPSANRLAALEYSPLYDEAVYLYCASDHPLFARDDRTISDAEIRACDGVQATQLAPQEQLRALRKTATASDREGVAFLILTGQFIGYLPDHFAARWVQTGRLRALRPHDYAYKIAYAVVTRKGRLHNRLLEFFLTDIHEGSAAGANG